MPTQKADNVTDIRCGGRFHTEQGLTDKVGEAQWELKGRG